MKFYERDLELNRKNPIFAGVCVFIKKPHKPTVKYQDKDEYSNSEISASTARADKQHLGYLINY